MTTARRRWRTTIRVRLTLLYAGAFFLAGAVLVALMYFYLRQVLDHQVGSASTLHHLTSDAQGALQVQLQRDRDALLDTMLIASLIMLGVFGVIAGALGWLLAGRALQPLQQITATARRVADRSLHERIALEGPDDEIKDLAETFDAMLERLDRAFDGQRRFVANASHELRTPLTINRTLIEVALASPQANEALRQLGATLLAVNQRHERLIDGLLTLTSSEQRIADPIPVDLADIAQYVIRESRDAARSAHADVRAELRPAPTEGDPVLLERLTQNLVDNAIRYNLPADGWIRIVTDVIDGTVHLTVENAGPAVSPYDIGGLFEPFRRLPATERLADPGEASIGRGAGLGLSIVRSVARAHGGDVDASSRAAGGLLVRVRLPAAPDPGRRAPLA